MLRIKWLFVLFLPLAAWGGNGQQKLQQGCELVTYLSWVGDPTSSMVVQWLGEGPAELSWRMRGTGEWKRAEGVKRPLVNVVELKGLKAGTAYEFTLGEKVRWFRTMPAKGEGVRFVVGGDLYRKGHVLAEMNRRVSELEPHFVVLGGDLAYAHGIGHSGMRGQEKRWRDFLKQMSRQMVSAEGRMIPMVFGLGNHDIKKKDEVQLFYEFFTFPQEGKAYFDLDFGKYLQLLVLDTGHSASIEGEQTEWLKKELKQGSYGYRMAVWHIAAYPSVYKYEKGNSKKIREHWSPLLEKAGAQVAFEHHNHALKRTHPIKGGQVDPEGVVYLGDGSWGVRARGVHKDQWYLAMAMKRNAVWVVDLGKESAQIRAIDQKGRTLDSLEVAAR